jgi:1-deoxypentalenic acid 11beta-hydroxylase
MDTNISTGISLIGELKTANHLLGDETGLQKAWKRDGYWFFRDVLDTAVIADIRQTYVDYLVEMGLTDPGDPEYRYNGKDYTHLPVNSNITKLNERKTHKLLHGAPTINAFFTSLFGCDPFWVPITVHRTNPPVIDKSQSRFDFIHEDGVYNLGLPFLICWVPIDVIDDDIGGLALMEGVHNGPCLHRREGDVFLPIREDDVPYGTWRRTTYQPGDVLLMGLHTPHSGMSNISNDRFRLSMDTRIMPCTGNVPYVGSVVSATPQGVAVADAQGMHLRRFDINTFIRDVRSRRLEYSEVPNIYVPGTEIIATCVGDLVINLRPIS